MSDHITNNEKHSILHRNVYSNDNYTRDGRYLSIFNNDITLCDEEFGFKAQVNTLDHHDKASCHSQREIIRQDSTVSDGNNLSDSMGDFYADELHRISSKLIQLLGEARQRSLKVKASCGFFEWPQRGKGQEGHCQPVDSPEASLFLNNIKTGLPGHGDSFVKHIDKAHMGSKSTGTTTLDGRKSSPGSSESTQLEQKGKYQGSFSPLFSHSTERHLAALLPSSFVAKNPGHGKVLVEHVNNVSLRRKSAGTEHSNKEVPKTGVFPRLAITSFPKEVSLIGSSSERIVTSRRDLHKEKERERKDIHNKIERKRRCFINDKIAELGNLLPEHNNRLSGLKKGFVLKETVEYIKKLRKDQIRVHRLEDKIGETCLEVKKLTDRLEQLETRMTTMAANSEENDNLHNETFQEEQAINTNLTKDKTLGHPSKMLHDPLSEILTTESEVIDLAQVWDDGSLTVSLPLDYGFDMNNMDCYF